MAIIAQEMLQEKKHERIMAIGLWAGLWLLAAFLVYYDFENLNLNSCIILILVTLYGTIKCYDLYKKPLRLITFHHCSVMGNDFNLEIGDKKNHWNFCPWCAAKITSPKGEDE